MPNNIFIRPAFPADAAALLDIYAPYILRTAVTYEYEIPTEAEFAARIARVLEQHPYLVARIGDEAVGYAYASPMSPRPAYAWAAETSIYVRTDRRRAGVGRALYQELERALAAQNIRNLYAAIAWPPTEDDPYLTRDSVKFHSRLGYVETGHFHACGCKFGRWYDLVWMEKHIGPHPDDQPPVLPFPEVKNKLFPEQ